MKNRMFFIDENETIEDVLEQIDNFFNKEDQVDKFEKISYFKKDTFNVLKSYINYLKNDIYSLQQRIDQYENPDDLTLFYMWLDEKAKDKMKEVEQENEDYKSRCEKAIEYINRHKEKLHHSFDEPDCDYWIATNPDDLLNILQNGSDDND